MLDCYVLDHHETVLEPDYLKWAEWFGTADTVVARTDNGVLYVSTVFLGIDHGFYGSNRPVLFETMTFFSDGFNEEAQLVEPDFSLPLDMVRWHDWEEAEAGHEKVCRRMFGMLDRLDEGPLADLVRRMRVDVSVV